MDKRIEYWTAAPDGYKAFLGVRKAVAESGLEHPLIHLVYLRVSQLNGCAYCVDLHYRDALAAGVDARKINSLVTWEEGPFYTPRERAALAWAEALTNLTATHAPDAPYRAALDAFGEKGLSDLSYAIALMNALNRLGVGFRMSPSLEKK